MTQGQRKRRRKRERQKEKHAFSSFLCCPKRVQETNSNLCRSKCTVLVRCGLYRALQLLLPFILPGFFAHFTREKRLRLLNVDDRYNLHAATVEAQTGELTLAVLPPPPCQLPRVVPRRELLGMPNFPPCNQRPISSSLSCPVIESEEKTAR